MKKFKLLKKETKDLYGTKLYRIQALRDGPYFKKGDKGGWVEKEENLSQEGECWVSGEARVYGGARVFDRAQVSGEARVFGEAQVYGEAWVSGEARVFDEAKVSGGAWVSGGARVSGGAQVFGGARVFGEARVFGGAQVYGEAWVYGNDIVTKTPKTFDPQIGRHHITVTDNNVNIGCEQHTLKHWLKNYKEIGKKNGYSGKIILKYKKMLDLIKIL